MDKRLLNCICAALLFILCSCDKEYNDYTDVLLNFSKSDRFSDDVNSYIEAIGDKYKELMPYEYTADVLHSRDDSNKTVILVYDNLGKCALSITYFTDDNDNIKNIRYDFYKDGNTSITHITSNSSEYNQSNIISQTVDSEIMLPEQSSMTSDKIRDELSNYTLETEEPPMTLNKEDLEVE